MLIHFDSADHRMEQLSRQRTCLLLHPLKETHNTECESAAIGRQSLRGSAKTKVEQKRKSVSCRYNQSKSVQNN